MAVKCRGIGSSCFVPPLSFAFDLLRPFALFLLHVYQDIYHDDLSARISVTRLYIGGM
jgi:hypothetical protein